MSLPASWNQDDPQTTNAHFFPDPARNTGRANLCRQTAISCAFGRGPAAKAAAAAAGASCSSRTRTACPALRRRRAAVAVIFVRGRESVATERRSPGSSTASRRFLRLLKTIATAGLDTKKRLCSTGNSGRFYENFRTRWRRPSGTRPSLHWRSRWSSRSAAAVRRGLSLSDYAVRFLGRRVPHCCFMRRRGAGGGEPWTPTAAAPGGVVGVGAAVVLG